MGEHHIPDLDVGDRDVALPASIARVLFGEALHDRTALLVGLKCIVGLASRFLRAAQLVVGHGEIALPAGIAWGRLCQALGDGKVVHIRGERRIFASSTSPILP